MGTVICQAKKKGIVKYRGKPTIEFYKDEKPQYYCYGYIDSETDEPLEDCKQCKDFVDFAQEDLEKYIEVSKNENEIKQRPFTEKEYNEYNNMLKGCQLRQE